MKESICFVVAILLALAFPYLCIFLAINAEALDVVQKRIVVIMMILSIFGSAEMITEGTSKN